MHITKADFFVPLFLPLIQFHFLKEVLSYFGSTIYNTHTSLGVQLLPTAFNIFSVVLEL